MFVDSNSYVYSSLGLLQLSKLKSKLPVTLYSIKGSYDVLINCPISKHQCISIKTKSGYHITLSYDSNITVIRNGELTTTAASDIQINRDYFLLHGSKVFGSTPITVDIKKKEDIIPYNLRYSSKNLITEYISKIFNFSFIEVENQLLYESNRLYNISEMRVLLLALDIFSHISSNFNRDNVLIIQDSKSIDRLKSLVNNDISNISNRTELSYPVSNKIRLSNMSYVDLNNNCKESNIKDLKLDQTHYLNLYKDIHFFTDIITDKFNTGFRDCCYLEDNFKKSFTINGILVKNSN